MSLIILWHIDSMLERIHGLHEGQMAENFCNEFWFHVIFARKLRDFCDFHKNCAFPNVKLPRISCHWDFTWNQFDMFLVEQIYQFSKFRTCETVKMAFSSNSNNTNLRFHVNFENISWKQFRVWHCFDFT